jgi:hypothetical protein
MERQITWGDVQQAKENQRKFRLKVEYKADDEVDEYRFDAKRAMEEARR